MKKNILVATAALATCACAQQKNEKPNIVFLLFDDLGYGDLGCYGQEQIETPNIDALASKGILFTDMYAPAPLSAPSRCCLLTARHMGHSQIRENEERYKPVDDLGWNGVFLHPEEQGQYPLEQGTPTLATMMQSAGYRTAMIGKWGLGYPGSGSEPNDMGFDYFYGFNCQALAHSYYPVTLWENGTEVAIDNDLVVQGCEFPDSLDKYNAENYRQYGGRTYSCDLMYDKMVDFIESSASSPFFVMWTTTVPHSAVQAPEEEVMYYVNKLGDEEPCTSPGMYLPSRYPKATYAAMISHIDRQVGSLVEKLKELGIWENTIFVVTSDNGPANNGNSPGEYFKSGGPFRCCKGWGKGSLREGGIRMPFILNWGDRHDMERTSHMAGFADIMQTFADLVGVEAPENDGLSFAPLIQGKYEEQAEHEALYWEFPRAKGWVAVRIGPWKGLLRNVKDGNTEMELYNLTEDPRETINLADSHPEILSKMWEVVRQSHEPANPEVEKYQLDINFPE